ncbi:MAG: hypothetical protein FWF57_07880 [Defluviitaleaceae bacterium]|nr:hypothetical protein [Defluviitaleaceae bacterium]
MKNKFFSSFFLNKKIKKLSNFIFTIKGSIIFISFFLIIGIIFGSIFANINTSYIFYDYINDLSIFTIIDRQSFIFRSFLIGISSIIIMWVLGFTKFFYLNIIFIIFRGSSFGFAIFGFFLYFGFIGIFYSFILFFSQNILRIFMYFFINISMLKFLQKKQKLEYVLSLLICLCLSFLITIYEAFLLTELIALFFI